ncbi:MAG TPA: hypothetical protein DCM45_05755 [Clostridiales bacterium]|nr:hypothetical protein [Clostridiales bacterium]
MRSLANLQRPVHRHDFFEICHVYAGCCELMLDGKFFRLTQGNFCIIAPESPHTFRLNPDDLVINILIRRSTFYAVFAGLMTLLLISTLRKGTDTAQLQQLSSGRPVSFDPEPLLKYLRQNYRDVSLSSLAAAFHYSEPYLCRIIQKLTGQTFTELLHEIRLQNARDLLISTDFKIADIAVMVGYRSGDYFSRLFRHQSGMSPSRFRELHRASFT